MRHALALASRALGRVAPNPAVGCVIVSKDGHIVGRGWTQPGGRPHAETVALAAAGALAKGTTAYVTLEPCSHHGETRSCADALITAGIARVVAAVTDPDPRVSGGGFAKLTAAGIAVRQDVLKAEATFLNEGFFKRISAGRPMVALKSAESADGFVAKAGAKHRITGERARNHGHLLRAQYDAIVCGIGTAIADDPLLTCRLPGMEDRSPIRIVLDTHLRLSPDSQLAKTACAHPVVVFTAAKDGDVLMGKDVEIARVPAGANGHVDLRAVLAELAKRGLTRALVEGGPTIEGAFLDAGLADRVYVYRAPARLGGGIRGIGSRISADARFHSFARTELGPDVLESYALKG